MAQGETRPVGHKERPIKMFTEIPDEVVVRKLVWDPNRVEDFDRDENCQNKRRRYVQKKPDYCLSFNPHILILLRCF
jgi:hypothetical protein